MEKKRQPSIKMNMILNTVKTVIGSLIPLITFPYASRILGAENLGKYSFANSIVAYFALFAALGLKTYAISYGPRYRDSKQDMKKFADSIFTINMVFTTLSYVLLLIFVLAVPKFHEYAILIFIISSQIMMTTIGMDWLNIIYEDYLYITIRSLLFYILHIVLLFAFVKNEQDLVIYTVITVISNYGVNVINYFYVKKYCKVGLTRNVAWKVHMKPVFTLFATSAIATIYISSDTTILGFMTNDTTVGIYQVSVKIYNIVKSLVSAMVTVSIPRLANLYAINKKDEFSLLAKDTYNIIYTMCIPAVVGLVMLSDKIIIFISGYEYIEATSSMIILSIAILFTLGAYFWGEVILTPIGKVSIMFRATIVSSVVNVVLNLIFIPLWQEKAAAMTTLIAEFIMFVMCYFGGRKYVNIKTDVKTFLYIIFGCMGIVVVKIIMDFSGVSGNLYLGVTVFLAIFVYFGIEYILGNDTVVDLMKAFRRKL